MTIKDFSRLCGCNPQTLRYYDREDLLKPVSTDRYSGYRHYSESQALTFVRIKNLQRAGFSISEIKSLLDKNDAEIYAAFERKIAETEQHLQEIKNIQKAYQTEIITMENTVEMLRGLLAESLGSCDPAAEFGIDSEEYTAALKSFGSLLDEIADAGELEKIRCIIPGPEGESEEKAFAADPLNDPANELLFQRDGWTYVKDFFDEIPPLTDSDAYMLVFSLIPGKANSTAFANMVMGMCIKAAEGRRLNIGCSVTSSDDGVNRFWLLKLKDGA